ncbi:MAG: histidine phosphatase family protein [Bdellovibrionaceae bacterium]|nr:histidine phosphatase family protein [Pseudobdellovibrionaceae bacterium]
MKSHLYLIRHGETDWNRSERLQGHSDIELNDLGRDQASRLRPFAEKLHIDVLAASDLKRAVATARLAFPSVSEIITDPRLREVHLGEAEGTNRHDLEKLFGKEILRAWFSTEPDDMKHRFPGGESRAEALVRITECLTEILRTHGTDERRHAKGGPIKIACVTHGLVIRTLTQSIVGEYRPEFRAPNCAVFEYEFDHPSQKMSFKTIHLLP